jgi:hypothetical protein
MGKTHKKLFGTKNQRLYTIKDYEYPVFLWLDNFLKLDHIVCEAICRRNLPKKRHVIKIYKESSIIL